jgi:hypothetical protein
MASMTRSLKSFGCGLVNRIRRTPSTVVIRIHGLPEQHHLAHAIGHDALDFSYDIGEPAAALGAARGRHDAVRAPIVTPALHGNPRLHLVESARLEVLVVLLEIERRGNRSFAAAGAVDQGRQGAIPVRADHHAHVLRLGQQLRAEPLRHAASHPDHRARLHVAAQLAEPTDDALLRVVANRARVDEDDVGAVGAIDRIVSVRGQVSEHQLGIAHVHLAPVRLDVNRRSLVASHSTKIA